MLLFRIPSFDLTYKPAIDSLISNAASSLARAHALIIDVRGNGGGGDAAFAGIIPLLYTDPIRVIGADAWASPANAAYFRDLLKIPELPASDRALVHRLVAEMERRPNHFVPIDRDTVLRFAPVHAAPGAVAVLFDRGSGSTTEEFLLQAQQSRKTVLFSGTRSAGALDYANVRSVPLPSGRWQFRFGTSRSRRLPTHPVDRSGLAPTVQIPPDATDNVTYVRGYLARR
jgi:C-terminal processing protease CtpA/Prc